MRARSVLTFLVSPLGDDGGGLDERNWSAAGYGSRDPVADNGTPEGRTKNPRVELVVLPNVEGMLGHEEPREVGSSSGVGAERPPRFKTHKQRTSTPLRDD